MALADYQAECRNFNLKGGSFSVTGLTLEHVALLVRTHLPDIERLFEIGEEVIGGRKELTADDMTQVATAVAQELPGFVASLITIAAGETTTEALMAARRLPAPVQVDVLVAIGELTFTEVGGVKKALESITGLLAKLKVGNPSQA